MLTIDYLKRSLFILKEFTDADTQILQGNGYDGVIDILENLRSVAFPCVVLEAGSSGSIQLVEGPVDTFTQSVWVMGQLGRGEDEAALYARMKVLSRKVAAKILADAASGAPEGADIDWSRYTYLQRYGGPSARGYELIFTFKENYSMLLQPADFKPELVRIADYLYKVDFYELDYEFAKAFFEKRNVAPSAGACSSVSTGTLFGGNLDYYYDNKVEFAVRTPRTEGKLATIGMSGIISELTRDAVEHGRHAELHKIIPFFLNDGMNECGVYCKVNLLPADKGRTTKSIPGGELLDEICSTMVVRFVLDHFSSAQAAVTYLQQHVSIFHQAQLSEMGYEAHWMIADSEHSYVVEIIDDHIAVTESPVMTNFYQVGVTFNPDGSVWTPADVEDGHKPGDNGITAHGSGLERFNLAIGRLPEVNDVASMRALMMDLFFTKAYLSAPVVADPLWHSEYVGELTVDDPASAFEDIEDEYAVIFSNRDRNTPETEPRTWHSCHASVYDAAEKRLHVITQEDSSREFEFSFIDG